MTFSVSSSFPDTETLAAGLRMVFPASADVSPRVVRREANLYESTFPSEIVTVTFGGNEPQRLFCKYSGEESNADHGHRGGVAYEAVIYRDVLARLGTTTPRFHGTTEDAFPGKKCLVLEFLEDAVLMDEASIPDAEVRSARWIGRFHAAAEKLLHQEALPILKRYDPDYFLAWGARALQAIRPWRATFPWLEQLRRGLPEALAPLTQGASTVIHGEFYPLNILVRGERIHPVDWESAAVGAGEIDLASLTDAWPEECTQNCEQEYQRARWPRGAPVDFTLRLAAARLYLALRWLADESERDEAEPDPWYVDVLRTTGHRLGVITP